MKPLLILIFLLLFSNNLFAGSHLDDRKIIFSPGTNEGSYILNLSSQNCSAQTVNWGTGCTGSVSALSHGQSTTVNNTASGYIGSVTVTCNDGSLTLSSIVCNSNCSAQTVNWGTGCTGSVSALSHGQSTTVNNTASGRTGSVTVTCNNGSLTQSSPICNSNCSAQTVNWGTGCTGSVSALSHGQSTTVNNTASGRTGSVTVTCNDGSLTQSSPVCNQLYQCPLTGLTYTSLSTCNSACVQTANCVLTGVTGFSGTASWGLNGARFFMYGETSRVRIYADIGGSYGNAGFLYLPAGITVSGYVEIDTNNCYMNVSASGDTVIFSSPCGAPNADRLIFTNVITSGSFTLTLNNDFADWWVEGNCWKFRDRRFGSQGCVYFNRYTCPLSGGSACSGSPLSCSRTATCVAL